VRLLGLPQEEHTRREIDGPEWQIIRQDGSLMPPEEYASTRALKENRPVENVEMAIIKGPEETTWISVTAAPIPLPGYGIAITYGDITPRKHAEFALEQERDLLVKVMDTSSSAITVVDCHKQITYANRRVEEILKLTRDEAASQTYDAPKWQITDSDGNPFPDEPFVQVTTTKKTGLRRPSRHPMGRRPQGFAFG